MRKSVIVISFVLFCALTFPLFTVVAVSPAHPAAQNIEARIDSPLPNSQLQGRVQIKGSAMHPQFSFYKVEFGPGESPVDEQMAIIGAIHEQQVSNNVLETWDTTLIPDGTYSLRLRVVDVTGNYQEVWVRRLSVNNTAPVPTPTPTFSQIFTPSAPTATPTIIPPTPTIVVEQPFLDQPTATSPPPPTVAAAGSATSTMLEAEPAVEATPAPTSTPAPSPMELFQPQEWGNALCFGALGMAGVFVLFGLLSGLRRLVLFLLNSR